MIIQQILIAKAATMKIEVSQADLDTAYNNAKRNLSDEAYQQELSRRNLSAADMREGLRREMLMQNVIEQEVGSKIAVTDKEINDFFAANRAQFNVAEESYHIAQIVITPVKEQQVSNGTGDDATTPQAAADKAKMLMERLKSGASFRELAVGYSEDAESAARGGDMGFIPVSRLKQAPPALRDSVLNKQPGSVNVAASGGAYTLVLVVAHEQAGQRDLTTPGMKERITETLRGRKEQLLRLAYLTSTRTEAKVENYLAKRLIEAKGEAPSLMPSPAAK
jgi:peptidyl-prolyl cis-trans isomerase SurA